MIDRLRNTSSFFIPYLILIGIGFVYYLYNDHGDFVLFLNDLHNPVWNVFFKYWTLTGNGFFYAGLAVILIFVRKRFGIVMAITGVFIGVISLIFKQLIFDETPRPKIYFQDHKILDFVDGVNILSTYSFPSGHAMAAFGIATLAALYMQSNKYSTLFLIGAVLTALSRVYLAQHFLIDIMAGSLLGMIISVSAYMVFEKYLNNEQSGPWNTPDEDLAEMDINIDD